MNIRTIPAAALLATLLSGCSSFQWPTELPMSMPVTVVPDLKGRVVDAKTGQPVAGARAYLSVYPNDTAVSAEDGRFVLKAIQRWQVLAKGTDLSSAYTLVVEAPAYTTVYRDWSSKDDKEQLVAIRAIPAP